MELLRLVPILRDFQSPIIAILGNLESPLAAQADVVLDACVTAEADPLGIVPTASSLVTLALGDALAAALMQSRKFSENDFARLHPAGQLGRSLLLRVRDVMHPLERVGRVHSEDPLKEAVIAMTRYPLGGACVLSGDGRLQGLITEGDIRRPLEEHDDFRSLRVSDHMTRHPVCISPEATLSEAAKLMEDRPRQISVLPVLEESSQRPVGLIRIHDIYQPNLL